MAHQIASLVGAACAAYLPGDNHLYKHLIGTTVSELIVTGVTKLQQTRVGQWLIQRRVRPQRKYELAIHDQSHGAQHRMYMQLEQLLVSRTTTTTTLADKNNVTHARLSIGTNGQMSMRRDLKSQLALIKRGEADMLSQVELQLTHKQDVLYVSAVPPNLRIARWQSSDTPLSSRRSEEEGSIVDDGGKLGPPIWLSSDTIDLASMEQFLTTMTKKPRHYELLVADDADVQHIYDELQEWILARCHESLYKGRADSKRGRLTVLPLVMNQAVDADFEKHRIQVSLGAPKVEMCTGGTVEGGGGGGGDGDNDDTTATSTLRPPIWLISRTAPIAVLQRFLFTIVNVEKPRVAKQLRVHRWIVDKSGKRGDRKRNNARWVTEYTLTNKTIANTIVADHVERELYDDVRKFVDAESYYAAKGLPWKRGYFLHGPPGTGKTSLIKAIANEFNLDIFSVDMECIESDSELIALTTEISQLKKGTNYIVAFEDVDRSNFFKPGRGSTLSKQCMLNVLDGISESYGRILFFTGNHPDNVLRMPAMVRPGRIDRCVEVDFVTPKQLARLFAHFYDELEAESFVAAQLPEFEKRIAAIRQPLSPAAVMEAMLKHDASWQNACRELFGGEDDDSTAVVDAESGVRFEEIERYSGYRKRTRGGSGKTRALARMERREKDMRRQLAAVDKPAFHERLQKLQTQIETRREREKKRKQQARNKKQRERNKQKQKKKVESDAKKVVRMAKQLETLKTRLVTIKRKRDDANATAAPLPDAVSARTLRAAKRAKHNNNEEDGADT